MVRINIEFLPCLVANINCIVQQYSCVDMTRLTPMIHMNQGNNRSATVSPRKVVLLPETEIQSRE